MRKIGDIKHYLTGKWLMMPTSFQFIRNWTLRCNLRNILFLKSNCNKFRFIYNELNKGFSFIGKGSKYKFWFFREDFRMILHLVFRLSTAAFNVASLSLMCFKQSIVFFWLLRILKIWISCIEMNYASVYRYISVV